MSNDLIAFVDSLLDWGKLFNWEPEIWDAKPLRTFSKSEEGKYVVTAEVPGINQDNLTVEYKDNILTITAEYNEKNESTSRRGKYKANYRIENVDEEGIAAKINNGLLVVTLPKKKEEVPKKIEIKNE